jgi:hypothetical protein
MCDQHVHFIINSIKYKLLSVQEKVDIINKVDAVTAFEVHFVMIFIQSDMEPFVHSPPLLEGNIFFGNIHKSVFHGYGIQLLTSCMHIDSCGSC